MATREEKLADVGVTKTNPHADLIPALEALAAKAKETGAHAGVADHLDECLFLCKRDIKQRELQEKARMGRGG